MRAQKCEIEKVKKSMTADVRMPEGTISGPAAWRGPDMMANPDRWRFALSAAEVDALETSAQHYLATGAPLAALTVETFPVPIMAQTFTQWRTDLIDGQGFFLLTGLPVDRMSRTVAATIFFGIGTHLGRAVSQNAAGHLLGHVRDVGADPNDPKARIYQTSARQTFHTDSADCVGLLCLKEAKEGGDSLLVSTVSIYNEIARRRPDLLPYLFGTIATDRRGEIPPGAKPYFEIPVLSWYAERLTGIYQRQYIDSAQRFDDAPRLTNAHVDALDLFDSLADDPALHMSMRLAPGDMQFVYNHAMLHDRTGFLDWPEPENRRHLLRLWLSLPGDRPLPKIFEQRFGTVEIGRRGGVMVENTVLNAPLD